MADGVLDFSAEIQKTRKAINAWGIGEFHRMGLVAEPMRLHGDEDVLPDGRSGCVISVFIDETTDHAFLCREWPEDGGITINILTNYEELKTDYPNTVRQMLKNAWRMYYYYDGPHGGRIRWIDCDWNAFWSANEGHIVELKWGDDGRITAKKVSANEAERNINWPNGKTIRMRDETTGIVDDCRRVGEGCMILDVNCNGQRRKLFYPCMVEGDYCFIETSNQEKMMMDKALLPNAEIIFDAWMNGLI